MLYCTWQTVYQENAFLSKTRKKILTPLKVEGDIRIFVSQRVQYHKRSFLTVADLEEMIPKKEGET